MWFLCGFVIGVLIGQVLYVRYILLDKLQEICWERSVAGWAQKNRTRASDSCAETDPSQPTPFAPAVTYFTGAGLLFCPNVVGKPFVERFLGTLMKISAKEIFAAFYFVVKEQFGLLP